MFFLFLGVYILAVILVIDDSEYIRELFRTYFEKENFIVYDAANGIEALAICKAFSIDVAICDLVMPEMDGIELIVELNKKFPQIRLISISSKKIDLLERTKELGAKYFFKKPVDPAALISCVKGLL